MTLSIFALLLSAISIVLTRINWKESNRPVVSAFVSEEFVENGVAGFNILLANTGTRPATNVRIYFAKGELEKLIDPKASAEARMRLAGCFTRDSRIPLIRNGEVLTGGLGHSSRVALAEPQLAYGAEAFARIEYSDLEGRNYISRQPLKVYAREGFTGISWKRAA